VTSGDFDGDGVKDFAVGLIRKDGKQPIVAVALARNGTWLISALKSWVDDPIRLYVKTVPSGIHRRTEASNIGPLAPTERELLRCNHPAVIVGATESTGVVYCYISKRWLYVWVSD